MQYAGRVLRWLGITLAAVLFVLVAVFGLLQTQIGKGWLEREIARAASSPDFAVSIGGLGGSVPFRMTVRRIDIGDRDGTYLTLHGIDLDISATALLARRAHIRSLTFAEIEMARSSTAPSSTPLIDYLRVPHLPVGIVLDRLLIDKLAIDPPVLGESLVATVAGNAVLAGGTVSAELDLHRIDGSAGSLNLAMKLAGDPPIMSLRLDGSEPTGVLLDRVLGRTDRLPLAFSVNGAGPIADWHGQLTASAGQIARFDADLALAAAAETVLSLSGKAAVSPLLPTEIAPLAGDRIALSLRARFGERVMVDPLSVQLAAGALTGNAVFGGPEKSLAAHLRADLPDTSVLADLLGQRIDGSAVLTAVATGSTSHPAVELNLSGSGIRIASSGAEHIDTDIRASPTAPLDQPDARIEFTANGRIGGLVVPEGVAVPPDIGRDIQWSLAGTAARDGGTVDLSRLSAAGAGIALAGSGQLSEGGPIQGLVHLTVADLRPFSGVVGRAVAGSLDIEATAAREGVAGFTANLTGTAEGLTTGIPAADALFGGSATAAGSLQRDSAGALIVNRLAITGAALSLSGDARFDPGSNALSAELALGLPRLNPLGPALGTELTGAVSARLNIAGALGRLQLRGNIDGKRNHRRRTQTRPPAARRQGSGSVPTKCNARRQFSLLRARWDVGARGRIEGGLRTGASAPQDHCRRQHDRWQPCSRPRQRPDPRFA